MLAVQLHDRSSLPRSKIFTCFAAAFLSFRINLSISAFFLSSSLVVRARALPPADFGKHMLNTMK